MIENKKLLFIYKGKCCIIKPSDKYKNVKDINA